MRQRCLAGPGHHVGDGHPPLAVRACDHGHRIVHHQGRHRVGSGGGVAEVPAEAGAVLDLVGPDESCSLGQAWEVGSKGGVGRQRRAGGRSTHLPGVAVEAHRHETVDLLEVDHHRRLRPPGAHLRHDVGCACEHDGIGIAGQQCPRLVNGGRRGIFHADSSRSVGSCVMCRRTVSRRLRRSRRLRATARTAADVSCAEPCSSHQPSPATARTVASCRKRAKNRR